MNEIQWVTLTVMLVSLAIITVGLFVLIRNMERRIRWLEDDWKHRHAGGGL